MASIAGVILAGGTGRRLGGANKATLSIAGRSLISIVLSKLKKQVSPIAISIGHLDLAEFPDGDGYVLLPDGKGVDTGPIGGLAAAVAWCGTLVPVPTYLLSVAVDAPFIPTDLAAKAMAKIGENSSGIVASCDGQLHPTHGLWRVSALRDLPVQVATDSAPKSLKALVYRLEAGILEFPALERQDPFRSINTPNELNAAARDLDESR